MPTSKPLNAAERRRDGEHRAVHAVDVDAALLRGVAVERGGAHRPAELGEAQEGVERERADEPDGGDQEIERPDGAAADPGCATRAAGSAARADRARTSAGRPGRAPARPRWWRAAGRCAASPAAARSAMRSIAMPRSAEPTTTASMVSGSGVPRCVMRAAHIGAHHVDRAVGEIDEMRHPVDQRQPDREQRIDVADHQAIDGVVEPRAGQQRAGHPRVFRGDGGSVCLMNC